MEINLGSSTYPPSWLKLSIYFYIIEEQETRNKKMFKKIRRKLSDPNV